MRVLWTKMGGLWPLHEGGRLRSFHTITELSHRHRVTVLTTHDPKDHPEELAAALPACERVVSVPYRAPRRGTARFTGALLRSWGSTLPVDLWKWQVPEIQRAVRELTRRMDLCVADSLSAAPNILPWKGGTPVVLFEHNVEYVIWRRLAEVERAPWRRALLEIEWRKMRWHERRACARADLTVAVSEVDRARLAADSPVARVAAISTGVDTGYFSPDGIPETPRAIVFSGSMDWQPNEDAVLYFIDEIWPRIRSVVADVSFAVVGKDPTPGLRAAAGRAGVQVTGTVADVRPHVGPAAVYVVPLRVGGGTRLKIFEALAMGKAVVSTTIGAEGLPLVPGEHFLCADEPAEFARAVVTLLGDPGRRKAMGAAGRRLVEERYSWRHVTDQFAECVEEVVARRAR